LSAIRIEMIQILKAKKYWNLNGLKLRRKGYTYQRTEFATKIRLSCRIGCVKLTRGLNRVRHCHHRRDDVRPPARTLRRQGPGSFVSNLAKTLAIFKKRHRKKSSIFTLAKSPYLRIILLYQPVVFYTQVGAKNFRVMWRYLTTLA